MPLNTLRGWLSGRSVRAVRNVAAAALVSVSLAGCYDLDATLTFKSDGTAAVTSRLDFPRDAEYVANFYAALFSLQPQRGLSFENGLCEGMANVPALGIDLQAREYRTDDRFGCAVVYQAGDSDQLVERLAAASIGSFGVVQVTREGPRRVRVELDFNQMPDITKLAPGLIMLGLMQQQQQRRRQNRPFEMPSPQAIDKAAKAYVEMSLALARMSAPNNHVQFAVHAPNVIETNGERRNGLVVFRWKWEDFTRLLMKPQSVEGEKRHFAVIEY